MICHLAAPAPALDATRELCRAPDEFLTIDSGGGQFRSCAEAQELGDPEDLLLESSSSIQSSALKGSPFDPVTIEDMERTAVSRAAMFDGLADNTNGKLRQGCPLLSAGQAW